MERMQTYSKVVTQLESSCPACGKRTRPNEYAEIDNTINDKGLCADYGFDGCTFMLLVHYRCEKCIGYGDWIEIIYDDLTVEETFWKYPHDDFPYVECDDYNRLINAIRNSKNYCNI